MEYLKAMLAWFVAPVMAMVVLAIIFGPSARSVIGLLLLVGIAAVWNRRYP